MVTEEQILREINNTNTILMEFRGNYEKQRPIGEQLARFLQKVFQEAPQFMVDLFWKYFEQSANDADVEKLPYADLLFTIMGKPNPYGIDIACKLLVRPRQPNLYLPKEDCARYLYDAKDSVAIPYLIQALDSDEYEVVREAAVALGNIGDPIVEPYLLSLVDKYDNDQVYRDDRLDDAYPIIRAYTFDALCLLNTPAAQQKILQSIFYDRDPGIQERATRFLIVKLPDRALFYLEKLLIDQSRVVEKLVSALPQQSIPYLEVLADNDDQVISKLAQGFLIGARNDLEQRLNRLLEEVPKIVEGSSSFHEDYIKQLSAHENAEIAVPAKKYMQELTQKRQLRKTLQFDLYSEQEHNWPSVGRHILAQYDDDSIILYQAYSPSIGNFATEYQYFGGDFRYGRMSWINPNFLWMMYRSGWGTKPNQEITLAIRIFRNFFDKILDLAVLSSLEPNQYESREKWQRAVKTSQVRLQWDPDHNPGGAPIERRAIQLGLRQAILQEYGRFAIMDIIDISEFVTEQRHYVETKQYDKLLTPLEQTYLPSSLETRKKLRLDIDQRKIS